MMDKSAIDEWILKHALLLSSFFAFFYIAGVVLIPLGLMKGNVNVFYVGLVCVLILYLVLLASIPLDEWLASISPLDVDSKTQIAFLEVNNYTAYFASIIPATFFVAFFFVALGGTLFQYAATGGYFELAYFIFFPAWRHYVRRFLGLNLITGASSFASIAKLFLSRSQRIGLHYFQRAIHEYQQSLLQNGVTNNALSRLDTMIYGFNAILRFKAIPFRGLALLADRFSRVPYYSRFSQELSRFRSRYNWVNDLALAPRRRSWVGRNATITLTILGLIITLTITEALRNQILTILTQATTTGVSQLIFALIVYLGMIPIISRAGTLYSNRVARADIGEFKRMTVCSDRCRHSRPSHKTRIKGLVFRQKDRFSP
jgi:hypothetical protein